MRRLALAVLAALALAVPAAAAATAGPAAALDRLLAAAKAGNANAQWAGLAAATRLHYGSASAFVASPAGTQLAATGRGPHRPLVEEPFPNGGALVAVTTARGAYAAAMHLERTGWKLQLDPNVLLQPISPAPGSVSRQVVQVAAQAMLPDPVDSGALYLDGRPLTVKGGAVNGGRTVTLFANLAQGVPKGRHTLVAYARGGAHAGALAWTFTVR